MISAISPIDGRYAGKCIELIPYYSEFALIKYRLMVEIRYILSLNDLDLDNFKILSNRQILQLSQIADEFDETEAEKIKAIETRTNHDVKAVEYYLKDLLMELGIASHVEFVHFGLTSQDINHTALPLLIRDSMEKVYQPALKDLSEILHKLSVQWREVPMLARTHGQAASPTTVGKELRVFSERLDYQVVMLHHYKYRAKFGGANGNLNAHKVAYPGIDWPKFADEFIEGLGLVRLQTTTQITHYDELAELFHIMVRINSILIDLARDIWAYISMDYFKQETAKGETGSSTMPHKVNPIDFENAEGNLGISNANFGFLAEKLPISRLQRDLTDSTVSRNIGVPVAHSLIAVKSLLKGLSKLQLNRDKLMVDLENNWAVVSEAIQTILRRENYPKPYEALKSFTRGKKHIGKAEIWQFIDSLVIPEEIKSELKNITPHNYLGFY